MRKHCIYTAIFAGSIRNFEDGLPREEGEQELVHRGVWGSPRLKKIEISLKCLGSFFLRKIVVSIPHCGTVFRLIIIFRWFGRRWRRWVNAKFFAHRSSFVMPCEVLWPIKKIVVCRKRKWDNFELSLNILGKFLLVIMKVIHEPVCQK